MGCRIPGFVVCAETKILIDSVRIYDFAGIHFPFAVPDRFEFTKRPDEVVAEHFRQEFRARLPVAMFTGERSTETDDEVCRFLNEAAVFVDAFTRLQIEINSRMKATLAKMPIQGAVVFIAVEKRSKLTQIVANSVRRNGGVFPSFPCVRLAGNSGSRSETQFANSPHDAFFLCILKELHEGRMVGGAKGRHQAASAIVRFFARRAPKLHQQPAITVRKKFQSTRVKILLFHIVNE